MSIHSFFHGHCAAAIFSRPIPVVAGLVFACAAGTPASAQSLFDILFGTRSRPVVYAPAPAFQDQRALDRERVARDAARRAHGAAEARRRAARVAAHTQGGGVSGKMAPLAPLPGVKTGSLAHFAADPTLRPGDIVVTTSGFMVYRGGHSERSSFAPIGSGRTALTTLEKASRRAAPQNFGSRALATAEPQVVHTVEAPQAETVKASLN